MKILSRISILAILVAATAGCNDHAFSSGGRNRNSAGGTETPPEVDPPKGPEEEPPRVIPPSCTDATVFKGAHMVFLMDNSGSMLETDCPNRVNAHCNAQTNREKAVLQAFDALSQITEAHTDQVSALSSVSLARFTPKGFGAPPANAATILALETRQAGRREVENKLSFTRQPSGDTPYLNAQIEGEKLVNAVKGKFGADGKPIVAVLVTDGEPTDADPIHVAERFVTLKQATGVQWITVMVNGGMSKADRIEAHKNRLLTYERNQGQANANRHWYTPRYNNFDAYFQEVIALPGKISDQIIEVNSSDELEKVILEEIINKKVECR